MNESRRWALVTGAARRLGAAIARELAAAGYSVAVHYHRSQSEAETLVDELVDAGVEACAYQADLRETADCEALVESVWGELGAVRLLVNNAGVFESGQGAEVFDRAIAVNLRAPYLLALAFGERMRAGDGGSIVNISSVGGLRPYSMNLPYSMSKAGLLMMTRGLAREFAPSVRVNAVAPGTVEIPGEPADAPLGALKRIPAGRFGSPTEIAAAVRFLARADYCTGQVLAIDGGTSL